MIRLLRSLRPAHPPLLLRPLRLAAVVSSATAFGSAAAHAMRIEEEVKLDYKDVLLRPKRSTLASRSQASELSQQAPGLSQRAPSLASIWPRSMSIAFSL
eukprot:scaffold57302_cov36-Tisochrysis_lutea.AAC.9